jgi:hypothetical protein
LLASKKRAFSIIIMVMIASVSAFLVYGTLAGLFSFKNPAYVLPPNGRIAFVKPVFTATAYGTNGFYTFYKKHSVSPGTYVTTDLNMLNLSVIDGWGWSLGLYKFITSSDAVKSGILLGNNSFIISDADVNNGALFTSNGTRAYDVAVVGFDEYVTDAEYNQYVQFVQSGGRLVLLDADNFYVKVSYNPTTNRMALVDGHGYSFNGTAATVGSFEHYKSENAVNFGSVYALFWTEGYRFNGAIANTSNPIGEALRRVLGERIMNTYEPHEENRVANSKDQIIAYWNTTHLPPDKQNITVAAYELDIGNGSVVHSCVFGSDIIASNTDMQLFLLDAIGIQNPHHPAPLMVSVYTDQYVYSVGNSFNIFGNVSGSLGISGYVNLQVVAPNGSIWANTQAPLSSDGSFFVNGSTTLIPLDQVGNYTVTAIYNGINASSAFTVIPAPCSNFCDTTPK